MRKYKQELHNLKEKQDKERINLELIVKIEDELHDIGLGEYIQYIHNNYASLEVHDDIYSVMDKIEPVLGNFYIKNNKMSNGYTCNIKDKKYDPGTYNKVCPVYVNIDHAECLKSNPINIVASVNILDKPFILKITPPKSQTTSYATVEKKTYSGHASCEVIYSNSRVHTRLDEIDGSNKQIWGSHKTGLYYYCFWYSNVDTPISDILDNL